MDLLYWRDFYSITEAVVLFEPCSYGVNVAARYLDQKYHSTLARGVACTENATVFIDRLIQIIVTPIFVVIYTVRQTIEDFRQYNWKTASALIIVRGIVSVVESVVLVIFLAINATFNLIPYKFFNGLFHPQQRHQEFFEKRANIRDSRNFCEPPSAVTTHNDFIRCTLWAPDYGSIDIAKNMRKEKEDQNKKSKNKI